MTTERKSSYRRFSWVVAILLAAVLFLPAVNLYHNYSSGRFCASCHEIWQPYTDWHTSTHRNILCGDCHGDVLTLEAGFHLNNIRRVVTHLRGNLPEQVRLKTRDVLRVSERCQKCHQQESAVWRSGAHSATYTDIFLDKTHNHQRALADDCLRCHGMHFEGGIRNLVAPLNTSGPWRLLDAGLRESPAIPCLSCHQMHHEGSPLGKPKLNDHPPGATQELFRPSLALFDRRRLAPVPVGLLPLPVMQEGARQVKISPDSRQALCYQCHAPLFSFVVGTGDDRTPVGVHEGLSCFACHETHGQKTRASCANCHPRLSNCGLNVETMDTTFKSAKSPHNIHFVKCLDCHTKGVPKKRLVQGRKPGGIADLRLPIFD